MQLLNKPSAALERTQQAEAPPIPHLVPRRAGLADVKPLRYSEIPRAINSAARAFMNNSLAQYFRSSDTWPLAKLRIWLARLLTYGGNIYKGRILTVDGGAAFLIYSTPQVNKAHWLVRLLLPVINFFRPAELVRRRDEYAAGVHAQVLDAFGTKVSEMYEIQGLATDPAAQGRGYGGLLIKTVTNMSDAEGRDVWVITSDAQHFYERHGFRAMRTVLVGTDNSVWTHKLVNVSITGEANRRL
ncbi:hypothetical protein BC628DRAFT_1418733 [Trametes gibbosa]|nr:hypothetical protein BC628DRAFT_1418733 [Trametes gibbosa]